jgi:excinuclease ABC subunit A
LARRSTGRTLYIMDEPTTGLHFDDVKNLVEFLNKLVDRGNTVLIIEHNLEVIKSRLDKSTSGRKAVTKAAK